MLTTAKVLVERTTGVRVMRTLPFGLDLFDDLRHHKVLDEPHVVFDVGAHHGVTVGRFLNVFRFARIIAFEPAPDTFSVLTRNIRDGRVRLVNAALSSEAGQRAMDLDVRSDLRRLGEQGAPITTLTIDDFSAENSIESIDYLKIDTEGHDLEVIRGATNMLAHTTVVETEVGIDPANDLHVPFCVMKTELESRGFRLFGIYEQWTPPKQKFLRRVNCVYVHGELAE